MAGVEVPPTGPQSAGSRPPFQAPALPAPADRRHASLQQPSAGAVTSVAGRWREERPGSVHIEVRVRTSGPLTAAVDLTVGGHLAALVGPAVLDGEAVFTATAEGLTRGVHLWVARCGHLTTGAHLEVLA